MEPIVSRCGYRCDLCLAYRPNADARPENRQILSDGWHKYFGFRIPPEKISCDGCLAEHGQLIDEACPVRSCVISRSLQNCASCSEYACEPLLGRMVEAEVLAARAGSPIPPEDRARFIMPYENRRRLEQLRSP